MTGTTIAQAINGSPMLIKVFLNPNKFI